MDLPNTQNTSMPHQTLGLWELLVGFRVTDSKLGIWAASRLGPLQGWNWVSTWAFKDAA